MSTKMDAPKWASDSPRGYAGSSAPLHGRRRPAGVAKAMSVLIVWAIVATGLIASPAGAAELSGGALVTETGELDQAVETLEPYVSRSAEDGTFALDAPPRVIRSVAPGVYATVLEGMEFVNGLILAGVMVSTDDLRVAPAVSATTDQEVRSDAEILRGKNEITCSWVNCTLRLDAYWTNKLVSALAAGAAAAGIASLLATAGVITSPAAIPSGLAAGILALGSAGVAFCSNEHGVWIRWGIGSWCGGQ